MTEPSIEQLSHNFWAAWKAFRRAWRETGGNMEMQVQIRDADAEKAFQRRSTAAKKAAATRRRRR